MRVHKNVQSWFMRTKCNTSALGCGKQVSMLETRVKHAYILQDKKAMKGLSKGGVRGDYIATD